MYPLSRSLRELLSHPTHLALLKPIISGGNHQSLATLQLVSETQVQCQTLRIGSALSCIAWPPGWFRCGTHPYC